MIPAQATYHPELEALFAKGEVFAVIFESWQRGVEPPAPAGFLAAFKRLNDAIDHVFARDYPEIFAEMEQERIEEAAEKYYEMQTELATIAAKWCSSPSQVAGGVPLLSVRPEFGALIEFARKRFVIARAQAPTVMLATRASLRDHSDGMFLVQQNIVYVASDLSDAEMEKTLLHEFAHAYERMKHWTPDEGFAQAQELELYNLWCDKRAAA